MFNQRPCLGSTIPKASALNAEATKQQPPPNCSRPSIEQVLRADRVAWVRLAERVHSLKRTASGDFPLDTAFAELNRDPTVLFHLLPTREVKVSDGPPNAPDRTGIDKDKKRKQDEAKENKQDSSKAQKAELPEELKSVPGLHMATEAGEKFCWPFNCAKGCRFAKVGKSCRRGKHACMKCCKNHSRQPCKE